MQISNLNLLVFFAVLIISGGVILATLKKFSMRVAANVFSFVLVAIALLVPLYFSQIVLSENFSFEYLSSVPVYIFSRRATDMATLCYFFGMLANAISVVTLLALVALIIVTRNVVHAIVSAFKKVPNIFKNRLFNLHHVCSVSYIPNYQNTFLKLGHLLN